MILYSLYFYTTSQPFWNHDCSRRQIQTSEQGGLETKTFLLMDGDTLNWYLFPVPGCFTHFNWSYYVPSRKSAAQQRQDSNKTGGGLCKEEVGEAERKTELGVCRGAEAYWVVSYKDWSREMALVKAQRWSTHWVVNPPGRSPVWWDLSESHRDRAGGVGMT